MATNLNNIHHGAFGYLNQFDGELICARITGAADVNANGYTINDGQWLYSAVKPSEGVLRLKFDRNFTGYVYGFNQCSLLTHVCHGCTAQSLTAAGGSTFDFTFSASGSVSDPDSGVIGIWLVAKA